MKLNTFLNYGGNCEAALRFSEQHLGGRITMLMRRAELPNQQITWPGWEDSIQYAVMDQGARQIGTRMVTSAGDRADGGSGIPRS